ncbi:MAG: hypothetical protein ACE5IR_11180 [bacterium]
MNTDCASSSILGRQEIRFGDPQDFDLQIAFDFLSAFKLLAIFY